MSKSVIKQVREIFGIYDPSTIFLRVWGKTDYIVFDVTALIIRFGLPPDTLDREILKDIREVLLSHDLYILTSRCVAAGYVDTDEGGFKIYNEQGRFLGKAYI